MAADLTTTGECGWLDLTDLGLDRFDADGNSRLAPEPISLPFPEKADLILILAQAADAELEDWGPWKRPRRDGHARPELWVDGDLGGHLAVRAWTVAVEVETNEVIYLCGPDDGDTRWGEPPKSGRRHGGVPKGWSGTWDMHETVRKVYSIF